MAIYRAIVNEKIVITLVLTSILSPALADDKCTEKHKAESLSYMGKVEGLLQDMLKQRGVKDQQTTKQMRDLVVQSKKPGLTCQQVKQIHGKVDRILINVEDYKAGL